MTESTVLSVRLSGDLKDRLDALATATRRSKSFLAAEAIEAYVELHEWQIVEIKAGLDDVKEGRVLSESETRAAYKRWRS